MAEYTRTLIFQTKDLGKAVDVMLAFAPPAKEPWKSVAWRVFSFPATGPQMAKAVYHSQLCFIAPQDLDGLMVLPATTWVPIDLGQETSLIKVQGGFNFSAPTTSLEAQDLIVCNSSGEKINIGVGFLNSLPTAILVSPDVGNNNTVKCSYTPMVSAYITSDHNEKEIIDLRGNVETSQPVWQQDLSQLSTFSTYSITMDGNGTYHITLISSSD